MKPGRMFELREVFELQKCLAISIAKGVGSKRGTSSEMDNALRTLPPGSGCLLWIPEGFLSDHILLERMGSELRGVI